jgi:hypothetical protein
MLSSSHIRSLRAFVTLDRRQGTFLKQEHQVRLAPVAIEVSGFVCLQGLSSAFPRWINQDGEFRTRNLEDVSVLILVNVGHGWRTPSPDHVFSLNELNAIMQTLHAVGPKQHSIFQRLLRVHRRKTARQLVAEKPLGDAATVAPLPGLWTGGMRTSTRAAASTPMRPSSGSFHAPFQEV